MALNINGRMKVKTLKNEFKNEFGLTLRLYDGRSFADDDATLASIRKGDSKGGEFSPKRNMKVGNFEEKIMDLFGIKVQIAGSDDSYLCDNDLTLAGALEEDIKILNRRKERASKNESEVNETNDKQDELVDVAKMTYDGHSLPTQEEIENMKKDLNSWLEDFIDDSEDYWNETSDEDELPSFKVRVEWADEPDYFKYTFGYDKYYMNWVNGHYEYSLENMIYMAMMNMGYYEKILHPDDYKEAVRVATDYPDSIYGINIWDEEKDDAYSEYAEEANEMINEILYGAVQFVGEKLCSEYGYEAVESFENLECQEDEMSSDGQTVWVVIDPNDTFIINIDDEQLFDYQEQLDVDFDGDLYYSYVYPTEELAVETAEQKNNQGWSGMKAKKAHWAANVDSERGEDWWEWNIE